MTTSERLDPPWLHGRALARLFAALTAAGGEARVIGGAVRNEIMGEPIEDIDLGTTIVPDEVMRRAAAAGLHPVPTGIAHGTVTVVVDDTPFEVTTLRRDVETHGRHAEVVFTTDWEADAHRRDLTINALSLAPDGRVFDYVGGLDDCRARRIRFIGDPAERMREDYLRILRFFRIHATYGHGPPDPEGLAAARAEKGGLARLSAERVQAELFRLLAADARRGGSREPAGADEAAPSTDPAARAARLVRVAATMIEAGILGEVLPSPASADRLDRAIHAGRAIAETTRETLAADGAAVRRADPDEPARACGAPEVRLLALTATETPARARDIATRLKLSRAATRRMEAAVGALPETPPAGPHAARAAVHRHGLAAVLDALVLAHAAGAPLPDLLPAVAPAVRFAADPPAMPVTARLLIERGLARPGPELGALLARLEAAWIDGDFTADREDLLARAARETSAAER